MPATNTSPTPSQQKTVAIVGGGVAGIAAAISLADLGFSVTLIERRGYLGGRASSYPHPGTGEVIDNCQHVLFGCCTNLVDLYTRLGVEQKIYWDDQMTLIEPGGRRSQLKPARLPAPLHGLPAILRAACFSAADKLALIYALVSIMLDGTLESRKKPEISLQQWLDSHHQTDGAMQRFWRLVIASALNADLDQISFLYARKVIRELFLNSAHAGAMGMSRVPLSDLFAGVPDHLTHRSSDVLFNCNVTDAQWDESAQRWTLVTTKGSVSADNIVIALPFEAMGKLLPHMPVIEGASALAAQIGRLEHWPICSVHLWFDREITELNHAVLLDRDIHWMYHKSRWQPERDSRASYVELVVSASREFATLSREEALQRAIQQLAEFFPIVAQACVVKSALIKEVRATFGVPPGIDASRPSQTSPWPNCYLAGDWTATHWPATMESAARSGFLAAEALTASSGNQHACLVPDLPPKGFMRFFGSNRPSSSA